MAEPAKAPPAGGSRVSRKGSWLARKRDDAAAAEPEEPEVRFALACYRLASMCASSSAISSGRWRFRAVCVSFFFFPLPTSFAAQASLAWKAADFWALIRAQDEHVARVGAGRWCTVGGI